MQSDAAPREDELSAYLRNAKAEPASFDAFADAWRAERIIVRCPGAGALSNTESTPRRIWGALQAALAAGASAEALDGKPCSWSPPCAFALFHSNQGMHFGGFAVPKPFALAVDAEGEDLLVSLTLFGDACEWGGEAMDALVRGLRAGLDSKAGRRPLAVGGRCLARMHSPEAPQAAGGAVLYFLTPVSVRRGDVDHAAPYGVLKSLIGRVTGMALWHGINVQASAPALLAEAGGLAARAEWRLDQAGDNQALRQAGRRRGVVGGLFLPPASPVFQRLLHIGAATHAGARCAEGRGRYRLLPLG